IDVSRLRISDRCHLIMPYHIRQDECEEKAKGNLKIGTTKNGIGPCYMDKCARIGLRMGDLLDRDRFRSRLEEVLPIKNNLLTRLYGEEAFDIEDVMAQMTEDTAFLEDMVCDTSWLLHEALEAGKKVMFEGAQGTLLDLDHGTYPFVTSSNPISGGAAVGAGVAPWRIQNVLGIVKAYTTRVGAGPFPTELEDEVGHLLQSRGHEFGTVTGRTRRCGWLDMSVVKYAIRLSGMTALALMKLDVLDTCETVKIATGYRLDGKEIQHFPASLDDLQRVEPIYESMPGWQEDTSKCRTFDELPQAAQAYVKRIEDLAGIPVKIVAVGPGREETIVREAIF
ncbi:MAG: adenylosuccinate synthase, partial [Peptococcus niger]